jgi:hypothetical protein
LTRANECAGIIAAAVGLLALVLALAVAVGWLGSSMSTTVLTCPPGTVVCDLNSDMSAPSFSALESAAPRWLLAPCSVKTRVRSPASTAPATSRSTAAISCPHRGSAH